VCEVLEGLTLFILLRIFCVQPKVIDRISTPRLETIELWHLKRTQSPGEQKSANTHSTSTPKTHVSYLTTMVSLKGDLFEKWLGVISESIVETDIKIST